MSIEKPMSKKSLNIRSELEKGIRKHRLGAYADAKRIYQGVLDIRPGHPEAMQLLGVAAFQLGDPRTAIESISRAITIMPQRADFYHNLANAYRADNQKEKACNNYRRAIDLQSDYFEAHLGLGSLFEETGELNEAEGCYRKALAVNPDAALVWYRLGAIHLQCDRFQKAMQFFRQALAHKPEMGQAYNGLGLAFMHMGQLQKAHGVFERAIQLNPDDTQAYSNLGNVLNRQGAILDAIKYYRQALAIDGKQPGVLHNLGNAYFQLDRLPDAMASYCEALELDPGLVQTHNDLGNAYREAGRMEEAIKSFDRALALKPDFEMALKNRGLTLFDLGRTQDAKACFQKLIDLKPSFAFEVIKAMIQPVISESEKAIAIHRKGFRERLTRLQGRNETLDDPFEQVGLTNFLLAMQGHKERDIREQIARFYQQVSPNLAWKAPNLAEKAPKGRIHIGFVSRFLYEHTIGRLYHGIIEKLSRKKFHVTVFHLSHREDSISERINQCADAAFYLPKKLIPAREKIAACKLHVLFYPEVGMDPLTYFISFARLAPVQIKRGFQITMGIPNIDYFLSSRWAEPKNPQAHYSERLILLKSNGYYYRRPPTPRALPTRKELGLPQKARLYACPQSLFKIHPRLDSVLSELLSRDRDGVLVLMQGKHRHWETLLMRRFRQRIPDAIERIVFLPGLPRDEFMKLFLIADAVLDTIHISGGNTSLECFALGVPVVTWPSPYLPGRLTYGFYRQMGILDCVADSLEEYVDLAIKLANDKRFYNSIKNKIKSRSSVLFEDELAIGELETFFTRAVDQVYGDNPRGHAESKRRTGHA
jgi:tetratricopeptide (TPR) repeat protein